MSHGFLPVPGAGAIYYGAVTFGLMPAVGILVWLYGEAALHLRGRPEVHGASMPTASREIVRECHRTGVRCRAV